MLLLTIGVSSPTQISPWEENGDFGAIGAVRRHIRDVGELLIEPVFQNIQIIQSRLPKQLHDYNEYDNLIQDIKNLEK